MEIRIDGITNALNSCASPSMIGLIENGSMMVLNGPS